MLTCLSVSSESQHLWTDFKVDACANVKYRCIFAMLAGVSCKPCLVQKLVNAVCNWVDVPFLGCHFLQSVQTP